MKPEYLIGFMNEPFPIVEDTIRDIETFQLKCLGHTVEVEVSQCKLSSSGVHFSGIITNRVNIADKLPMHGHGSHSHIDEINTMFYAVILYCHNYDLKLIAQYNNWPTFRGAVTPIVKLVDNPDHNGLFLDERDLD